MTRISLISTIQVCDVPRHLNVALNWAFDEADWHNALPSDVPAGDHIPRLHAATMQLMREDTDFNTDDLAHAFSHLCNLQAACEEDPDARVVVE